MGHLIRTVRLVKRVEGEDAVVVPVEGVEVMYGDEMGLTNAQGEFRIDCTRPACLHPLHVEKDRVGLPFLDVKTGEPVDHDERDARAVNREWPYGQPNPQYESAFVGGIGAGANVKIRDGETVEVTVD